jgi:hypothetical protein
MQAYCQVYTCMCDYRRHFALNIGFIDHLYTRLGTTSDYSATTSFHNSQITTAACCVFSIRSLVTASNSEDSSASALKASLNGGSHPNLFQLLQLTLFFRLPLKNSLGCLNCLPYNSSARPAQTTPFILVCVPVTAGTCLPSRSLAALVYSCLLKICCLATEVVSLSLSRPLPRNECCFRDVR